MEPILASWSSLSSLLVTFLTHVHPATKLGTANSPHTDLSNTSTIHLEASTPSSAEDVLNTLPAAVTTETQQSPTEKAITIADPAVTAPLMPNTYNNRLVCSMMH